MWNWTQLGPTKQGLRNIPWPVTIQYSNLQQHGGADWGGQSVPGMSSNLGLNQLITRKRKTHNLIQTRKKYLQHTHDMLSIALSLCDILLLFFRA